MNLTNYKLVRNPNKECYLEWDDEDLKGRVKFLKYYERLQNKDGVKLFSEIEFNKYGSILKKHSFENGSLHSLYEISIDKFNNLIHYKTGCFDYGEFNIDEFSAPYNNLHYNTKDKGSLFNLNNNNYNEKYDNNGRVIEYVENFKNSSGFQIDIFPIVQFEIIRRYSYSKSGQIISQTVSERYITDFDIIPQISDLIGDESNLINSTISEEFIYKEQLQKKIYL